MQIKVNSRIHTTLISLHTNGYRQNGGFGFAIEEPSLNICGEQSQNFEIIDHRERGFGMDEKQRLLNVLDQTADQKKFPQKCTIEISGDVASHMGFGTGTAIRLASLELLYLINEAEYTEQEIINDSGRGGTSGIGIHTYFNGGYVFDIGRSDQSGNFTPSCATEKNPSSPLVLIQGTMPEWEIGLCTPKHLQSKSEAEEKAFFNQTCPIEPSESYEALYHIVYGVLGGIKEDNRATFSEAIKNIQLCRWKSAERQLYGDSIKQMEQVLYKAGATAIGMSSLGASLFFIAEDMQNVIKTAKELLPECDLSVTRPNNTGRIIIHD
jgi:beta-ribofuranosylaminobenzene 5'-phosphate synthase